MTKVLKQDYFKQKTTKVAKNLIGKYLVRKQDKEKIALEIKETEAYIGPEDKASHAYNGKTERNKIMYAEGGHIYIYLIYGIHYMLNIVTESEGYPTAVLIRAAGEYDGPGKLTKALSINDKHLHEKRVSQKNKLWIEDRNNQIKHNNIESKPRVGIDYADEWAKKPLRFTIS